LVVSSVQVEVLRGGGKWKRVLFFLLFFLKFVFKAVSPGEMISLTCIFLV